MANEKKTELEQLQDQLAAATKTIEEQDAVIAEQAAELEKLGAEKSAKAPVIVYKKKKYAVRATSTMLKIDGQLKKLTLVNEKGEKAVEDSDLAELLKVEGQTILQEV